VSNHSYSQYVEGIAHQFLKLSGKASSPLLPLNKPSGLSQQPRVLIFSPHPDDECLMAGCVLRMQEEWGATVTVVPYSYGSDVNRRMARLIELKEATQCLGFDLLDPRKNNSMDKLTVTEFADAVNALSPEIIVSPHARDFHPAHMETHQMVASMISNSSIKVWIQTEYWQAAEKPNFFVPLSVDQVVKIGEALQKHVGEVSRNPYHLSLPAWYMDQARRAPELISGFGGKSETVFGQLLQVRLM
jgi:LmbE family N-acetylglucosaminyl deacetylase